MRLGEARRAVVREGFPIPRRPLALDRRRHRPLEERLEDLERSGTPLDLDCVQLAEEDLVARQLGRARPRDDRAAVHGAHPLEP